MLKSINIIMGYKMGGIFSVYKLLAPELAKRFKINTITLDDHLRQGDIPGINQIDLNVISPLRGYRLIYFFIKLIYVSKRYQLDNFVVNNQSIAIVVYVISIIFGTKYFIHQHSTLNESLDNKKGYLKKLYIKMLQSSFGNAQCVICNSLNIEANVRSVLGVENTVMIYNPVNIDSVIDGSMKSLEVEFVHDTYNFVIVGRLSYEKGHKTLIDAVNYIKKNHSNYNFKVYIIGDGQEYVNLKHLIEEYGLLNEVSLLGFIPEPYQYIMQCDCYLNTSLWEGFGLTLAYSMLLRKPIIASRTGAAVELLADNESLFDIGDHVSLGNLMIKAMSDKIINDAAIQINYTKAREFSLQAVTNRFVDLYSKYL